MNVSTTANATTKLLRATPETVHLIAEALNVPPEALTSEDIQ